MFNTRTVQVFSLVMEHSMAVILPFGSWPCVGRREWKHTDKKSLSNWKESLFCCQNTSQHKADVILQLPIWDEEKAPQNPKQLRLPQIVFWSLRQKDWIVFSLRTSTAFTKHFWVFPIAIKLRTKCFSQPCHVVLLSNSQQHELCWFAVAIFLIF